MKDNKNIWILGVIAFLFLFLMISGLTVSFGKWSRYLQGGEWICEEHEIVDKYSEDRCPFDELCSFRGCQTDLVASCECKVVEGNHCELYKWQEEGKCIKQVYARV